MSNCKHRWRDAPDVTERIYCTKCGLTTVPSLDIKRIEELEAKHQWQLIETAPKDGTEIFIFHAGWPWAPVAKWTDYPGNPVLDDNNEECCMDGWLFDEWFTPGNEDGWLGWSDDEMPTHWSHLPEPPENQHE